MVRAENVRRVELIGSLLADLLTAGGQQLLVKVPQFDLVVDLLFQVIARYSGPLLLGHVTCRQCIDAAIPMEALVQSVCRSVSMYLYVDYSSEPRKNY